MKKSQVSCVTRMIPRPERQDSYPHSIRDTNVPLSTAFGVTKQDPRCVREMHGGAGVLPAGRQRTSQSWGASRVTCETHRAPQSRRPLPPLPDRMWCGPPHDNFGLHGIRHSTLGTTALATNGPREMLFFFGGGEIRTGELVQEEKRDASKSMVLYAQAHVNGFLFISEKKQPHRASAMRAVDTEASSSSLPRIMETATEFECAGPSRSPPSTASVNHQ